jgi:hypothetical protein
MGNILKAGKATYNAASKVTNPEAWRKYEVDLQEWQETCDAMAKWESDQMRQIAPGPCCLSVYWCQMCCAVCEVPCRSGYHFSMWGLGTLMELCFCKQNELLAKQAIVHGGIVSIYWWTLEVLFSNLCEHPCQPLYVYEEDLSLERPAKPLPPGFETNQQSKEEGNTNCGCCSCCGSLWDCKCMCLPIEHSNRLFRAAFCCLGCHHSCHPALLCGPLCTDPDCCICCESWTKRFDRWDRESAEAKQKRTQLFYERTGRTYQLGLGNAFTAPQYGNKTSGTQLGKPRQQEMNKASC